MQFRVGGTTRMTLATNNLGIGTTAPASTLNIKGNVGIGTAAGDAYLTTTAPNGGMIMYGNLGIGTFAPTAVVTIPSLKSTTGTRYVCIDTAGNLSSSAAVCTGT
jgi:hypothetical protein